MKKTALFTAILAPVLFVGMGFAAYNISSAPAVPIDTAAISASKVSGDTLTAAEFNRIYEMLGAFSVETNSGTQTIKNIGLGGDAVADKILKITGATEIDGSILITGDVEGDSFYYSSDARLKENVQNIWGAKNLINALRGVRFDWIESGDASVGFIAQEVETIFPELVKTKANGFKAVEYGNIVAVAVEAIQEAFVEIAGNTKKIEALEVENKNLKARLEKIEAKLGL